MQLALVLLETWNMWSGLRNAAPNSLQLSLQTKPISSTYFSSSHGKVAPDILMEFFLACTKFSVTLDVWK